MRYTAILHFPKSYAASAKAGASVLAKNAGGGGGIMNDSTLSSHSVSAGLGIDKTTALAIGFGLHNAWVCTTMYSTDTVFGISFSLSGIRGGELSFLYFASIIAFCLMAFVAAVFDQRFVKVSRSRRVMGVAALVTSAGTLLALASPAVPQHSLVLECCSGVVTGLGSVTLMLYWGIAFAREKAPVVLISAPTAVVLGFALNTLVLQSIPVPFGGLVSVAIPMVEFCILRLIVPGVGEDVPIVFNALPTSKMKLGLKLVVPIALVGFALAVLKHVSVQTTLGGRVTPDTLIILLLAGSLTISLFALCRLVRVKGPYDSFFRVVVPAMACASLVASLFVSGNETLSDLFLLVTYIFIETLMWVYFAYIAHKVRLSPIFLFGLSRGMLTLSMFFGAVVSLYASPWLDQQGFNDAGAIVVVIVLIALGYALMPRESDVVQCVVECPAVRLVSLELEENLSLLTAHRPPAAVAGPKPSTQEWSVASFPVSELPSEMRPASGDWPEEVDEPGEGSASPAAEDTCNAGEGGATPPMSEARKAMLSNGAQPEVRAPVGRFSRKVRKVAQTYLLTERETDILFELAKGNGPDRIQAKYFISAGTVKTHIRNVYRKIGVHKRSDLLRLVEDFEDFEDEDPGRQ